MTISRVNLCLVIVCYSHEFAQEISSFWGKCPKPIVSTSATTFSAAFMHSTDGMTALVDKPNL